MPTPSPIIAPIVGAAVEISIVPASSAMPPTPAATATRASAIGTSAATTVPNATTSTTSAASRPAASAPEVSVSALMNAASPPSSAMTPASRAGEGGRVTLGPLPFRHREDRHGAAAGRFAEALLEQLHRLLALAAGSDE